MTLLRVMCQCAVGIFVALEASYASIPCIAKLNEIKGAIDDEPIIRACFAKMLLNNSVQGSGNILCALLGKKVIILRSGAFAGDDTMENVQTSFGNIPVVIISPIGIVLRAADFQLKNYVDFQPDYYDNLEQKFIKQPYGPSVALLLHAFRIYLRMLYKIMNLNKSVILDAETRGIIEGINHSRSFDLASVRQIEEHWTELDSMLKELIDSGDLNAEGIPSRLIKSLFTNDNVSQNAVLVEEISKCQCFLKGNNKEKAETMLNLMRYCLHTEAQLQILSEIEGRLPHMILSMLNPCESCQALPIVISCCQQPMFYYFQPDQGLKKSIKERLRANRSFELRKGPHPWLGRTKSIQRELKIIEPMALPTLEKEQLDPGNAIQNVVKSIRDGTPLFDDSEIYDEGIELIENHNDPLKFIVNNWDELKSYEEAIHISFDRDFKKNKEHQKALASFICKKNARKQCVLTAIDCLVILRPELMRPIIMDMIYITKDKESNLRLDNGQTQYGLSNTKFIETVRQTCYNIICAWQYSLKPALIKTN